MKTIYIFYIFILFPLALISNELSWIDQQIDTIKLKRVGIDYAKINYIKDPFIVLKTQKKKQNKHIKQIQHTSNKSYFKHKSTVVTKAPPQCKNMSLELIINNKAMINHKWYKISQKVCGYKILNITNGTVYLTKNKKQTLLTTKERNNNIHFIRDKI